MPSGPKKRKAARKKKEKESGSQSDPSSSSAPSHEVDDGKQQDDRESNVAELSSPASEDLHSHQNLLIDGEEEEIEKEESCSAVRSAETLKIDDSEDASIVIENENAGKVKRELEIPSEYEKKDERIEYYKPSRKAKDGGSSDSSGRGSSSNLHESEGIKDTQNIVDDSLILDSVKAAASLEHSGKNSRRDITEGADNSSHPIEKSVNCCLSDPALDEKDKEKISSVDNKIYSVAFTDAASERREAEATIQSIQNNLTISDPNKFETQENGDGMTKLHSASGAQDSAVSKQWLAPALRPEQTTWKSCCGLFEVFARSDG